MTPESVQSSSTPAQHTATHRVEKRNVGISAPEGRYLARFGTFMLIVDDMPSKSGLMEKLQHALEADSRVAEILSIDYRPDWMDTRTIYRRATNKRVPLDGNGESAFRLSDPITFKVHVPHKNQKPFRGQSDIPSADYWVGWDGVTMVVTWPHEAGTEFPRSGGHIAIDILRDVVNAAGFELYDQPCSPGCTNGFAHTTMIVERCDDDSTDILYARNGSFVDVHLHTPDDPGALIQALTNDIGYESRLFAMYKNQARHARDIETFARDMAEEILAINIKQIDLSRLPLWRRTLSWRTGNEHKRNVRELTALLWLALARIEATRRDWSETRRRLENAIEQYGTGSLFETDRVDDDGALESLDLSFIKAAVEQSSARLDSHTMASATALGAVAGILGACAGAIATTLAG